MGPRLASLGVLQATEMYIYISRILQGIKLTRNRKVDYFDCQATRAVYALQALEARAQA